MNPPPFLECPLLVEAGVAHGFGTRASTDRVLDSAVSVRQVHGTRMLRAPLASGPESAPEADALWTSCRGLAVAVVTADCVPILLVDRRGRAVAALHAGWRGSVAGIAERAIATLERDASVSPRDLWAVIGPHIGVCCYEVDEPVIRQVSEPGSLVPALRPGHALLDLFTLNRAQLLRAGVPSDSILRVPGCTHCDTRFHSYRRDGSGGRMLHFVRMPD